MSNSPFRLKIYGVRGSYPPTSNNGHTFGVNTTCLRFDIEKHVVIIDAGTGIINLGNDLFQEMRQGNGRQNYKKLHFFFTHLHIDHLMGFPYFLLNYIPDVEMHFIAPRILTYSLEQVLEFLMSPALFPVTLTELPSRRTFYDFSENLVALFFEDRFEIYPTSQAAKMKGWQGRVSCLRNYTHPKGGAYIYKVEHHSGTRVVFATDVEGFIGNDQRLVKFAKDADILIHDAQYTLEEYAMFQGFGHSTYEMACAVAKAAGVKKLLLTHHDPKHGDEVLAQLEAKAREIFPQTHVATEFMEFSF